MHPLKISMLLVSSLVACGGGAKQDTITTKPSAGGDEMAMPMKMGMAMPSAQSRAVFAQAKAYASWPTFAENPEPKASKGHMDMFVVTYHNDVVTTAIAAHTLPLPDGAIIVKENRMKADEPAHALTIMSKQGGKWYWLETSPDGGQVMTMNDMPQEGFEAPMCVKCHADAAKNDYVFTHSFAK
jgi:hypothetical protein